MSPDSGGYRAAPGAGRQGGGNGARGKERRSNGGGHGRDRSDDRGKAYQPWAISNGKVKAPTESESAAAGRAKRGGDLGQRSEGRRRFGTYERERQQRCSVLHYLTLATTPQPADAGADTAAAHHGAPPTSMIATHPRGATASALLAVMRKHPWEGRPGAGTAKDWAEWLEHLEPTLDRHLRWLAADGLAAEWNTGNEEEGPRYLAVARSPSEMALSRAVEEERARAHAEEMAAVEPGGQESAGRLAAPVAGGRVAAAGGAAGPGADTVAAGPSMLAGGVRIMKSRPIKMVKPWR